MKTSIQPVLITLALACFALSPQARAVCQEGCDTVNFNTFLGDDALVNNTTGFGNTAIGSNALASNTTGTVNTATGYAALKSNTTGILNTATGAGALDQNTTGNLNTAIGSSALASNTIGNDNTATGYAALYNNTTGNFNTAIGEAALTFNTTGYLNTATGALALDQNTTGYSNTAIGSSALLLNTTGTENTATGASALSRNTTGSENTAMGYLTLNDNSTGLSNTATGFHALSNNTSGNSNIALGANAGEDLTTGDENIDIGNEGFAGESNTIRIGTEGTHTGTYIAGINGAPLVHGAAVAVGITPDGQLGVRVSSAQFKEGIKPMEKASEAIFSLQPVTFRYKKDPTGLPQFGLVAEEVAKVDPDLVARDVEGKPFTVRYDEINAMLLNEFLKEHREVQEQRATIAEFKKEIANLTAMVNEQESQIQKVSAQLAASQPAPQVVNNP